MGSRHAGDAAVHRPDRGYTLRPELATKQRIPYLDGSHAVDGAARFHTLFTAEGTGRDTLQDGSDALGHCQCNLEPQSTNIGSEKGQTDGITCMHTISISMGQHADFTPTAYLHPLSDVCFHGLDGSQHHANNSGPAHQLARLFVALR